MEGKKTKLRIIKLTENRYMVQKLGMWITPDSYGNLVPSRANETKTPVDLETAEAIVNMYKKDKEVVKEVEIE